MERNNKQCIERQRNSESNTSCDTNDQYINLNLYFTQEAVHTILRRERRNKSNRILVTKKTNKKRAHFTVSISVVIE